MSERELVELYVKECWPCPEPYLRCLKASDDPKFYTQVAGTLGFAIWQLKREMRKTINEVIKALKGLFK